MPVTVRVGSGVFTIPDDRQHVLVEERVELRNKERIRTTYTFNLPDEKVVVRVFAMPYQDPGPLGSRSQEEESVLPAKPLRFDQRNCYVQDIEDFLVNDDGCRPGDKPHKKYGNYAEWKSAQEKENYTEWKPAQEKKYKEGKEEGWGRYTNVSSTPNYRYQKASRKKPSKSMSEAIYGKEGEIPMSDLTTGTRVRVPGREGGHSLGTVVEVDPKQQLFDNKQVLLCMDLFHGGNKAHPETCGEGHGQIVRKSKLSYCKFSTADKVYEKLPLHVGMYAPRSFKHDNIKFGSGAVGRVTRIGKDRVTLRWYNVLGIKAPFWVPLAKVQWCYFDPNNFDIMGVWHSYGGDAGSVGDILVYDSDVVKMVGSDGRDNRHVVARGTILKRTNSERYDAYDGPNRGIKVQIMSGASPAIIGRELVVSRREVYPFENPFIKSGNTVEIVADLTFRKKSLQGRKGVVILSTDLDGDIGIEFPEDIGAGSLDGVGREGRCLYLPTDSVKKI